MENKCRICGNPIDNLIMNYIFSNCYTKYSNVLIQDFLESILCDKIQQSEDYVCWECYNVVNELDQLREKLRIGCKRIKQMFVANKSEVKNSLDENIQFVQSNGVIDTVITSLSEELNKQCNSEPTCSENRSNVNTTFINTKIVDKNMLSQNISNQNPKWIKQTVINNCNICSKHFKTPSALKKHVESHNVNKLFTCEVCGASYKSEKALKNHIGMHNGINPFTCEYCHKSFTQKISMLRHLQIHTKKAAHQCDLCGKLFIHHTSFQFHKMTHTGQKDIKCDVCGLAFRSTSHLKRHSKIHTGEKKFSCKECGKQFAEKYNLSVHGKLHEAKEVKKYECEICHVIFKKKLYLENHLGKNHQKIAFIDVQ